MHQDTDDHVLGVYNRFDIAFDHGAGARLYAGGQEYLDFVSGIGVNALGHAHPAFIEAMTDQVQKLVHVGNLYKVQGLEELSSTLCSLSGFAKKAFLCNSGAEANECGIKMIRKYQHGQGHPEKHRIVVFDNAFHGRTLATIFASAKDKMVGGFGPETVSYDIVPFGDMDAVLNAIGPQTGGIMLEPIQGEGGIKVASNEFLLGLRTTCDDNNLVLLFDEIQAGAGRTGKFYSYQWSDVCPDIVTSAKGIGGGFPVGACLASDKIAQYMTPGTHGSTYSGNPLAVRMSQTVLDIIGQNNFLKDVTSKGEYVLAQLQKVQKELPAFIEGVGGKGLMIGIKIAAEPAVFVEKLLYDHHLLTAPAGGNCVRLLPPLIISKEEIDVGVSIIRDAARSFMP